MTEAESFKASRESRADVASRAARSGGHTDAVRRLVDAAVYRETHRAVPLEEATEDSPAADADVEEQPCR